MTKRDELIALGGVGVKVKLLEWQRIGDCWKADRYSIRIDHGVPVYYIVRGWDRGTNPHDTLDAAKAAAQADYERRILSALEAPAAGDGEPVAWQGMDTAPKGHPTEDAGCRGPSEWFVGRPSKKYGPSSPIVVVRRRAWPQDDHWEDNGETYYRHDYFDGWRPLSLYTAPPADAAMREATPDDLRALGWAVAVHNDYRLNGSPRTFWLFTKDGRAVKGEGRTDAEALNAIRAALTAPGATTKSDGPASQPQLVATDQLAGANTANGPSDPSSTRSEVTASLEGDAVERVARIIADLRHAASGRADRLQQIAAIDAAIAFLSTIAPDEAAIRADEREKCEHRVEELDCLYINDERCPFGGIPADPETSIRREAIKECLAALRSRTNER